MKKIETLLLFLFCLSFGIGAQEKETGDFNVIGNPEDYEFVEEYGYGVLVVKSGEVTVSNKSEKPTDNTIRLEGGTLVLDGVHIETFFQLYADYDPESPISIKKHSWGENVPIEATIKLADGSTNTLISNNDKTGINVPTMSKVTFVGSGSLEVESNLTGAYSDAGSPAIGSYNLNWAQDSIDYSCGTIIFNLDKEGSITAKGGYRCPGIGVCCWTNNFWAKKEVSGLIQINSGNITAIGGRGTPGIGTGASFFDFELKGTVDIIITGGSVVAKSTSASDLGFVHGIGNGMSSRTNVNVTITGGYVNASIGKGVVRDIGIYEDSSIIPQPAIPLQQVIIGPEANMQGEVKVTKSDTSAKKINVYDREYKNGFVFESGKAEATVKGTATIPENTTITIPKDKSLKIGADASLNVDGTLINNGSPLDNNKVQYLIKYNLNDGKWVNTPEKTYKKAGETISLPTNTTVFKDGYNLAGWAKSKDGNILGSSYIVEAGANELYAIWTDGAVANETIKPNIQSKVWGSNGAIHILPAVDGKVSIYNMNGVLQLVAPIRIGEEQTIYLESGMYIIVLPEGNVKAVI